METIVKYNTEKLKNEIKELVETQRFLKDQRKSVHNKIERKVSPSEATWKHSSNREELRLLYAAYGLMRGKSFSQTENKYPEENHPLNDFKSYIEKIMKKYEVLVEENQAA